MLKFVSALAGFGLLVALGAITPASADTPSANHAVSSAKKKVVRHARPRVRYRTVYRTRYVYPRYRYRYARPYAVYPYYRPYTYGYYRPYSYRPYYYGYSRPYFYGGWYGRRWGW